MYTMSKTIKIGAEVRCTPAIGQAVTGRVVGRREKFGQWIDVNVAPKGKPKEIKSFRPGSVTAV